MLEFEFRPASGDDADEIAQVFSVSRRLLDFLPELHSVEEDRAFIANVILCECDVTVARHSGKIVSFLARRDQEIRLLYTHPDYVGRGAGSALINAAKGTDQPVLELWCFQANARALRFHEQRGFRPILLTGGEGNEEKTPDIRYRWERSKSDSRHCERSKAILPQIPNLLLDCFATLAMTGIVSM